MSNIIDKKNRVAGLVFYTNNMKALALFLKNPSASFYGGEVAKRTGLSRAGANFALRDLSHEGLLLKEGRGRMDFYRLDGLNPVARQMKVVFNVVQLVPLTNALSKCSIRIVLYGSAATGENAEDSDTDLLILSRDKKEVEKIVGKYFFERLQPVIHTPQEWAVIEGNNPVFAEETRHGLILWESHES